MRSLIALASLYSAGELIGRAPVSAEPATPKEPDMIDDRRAAQATQLGEFGRRSQPLARTSVTAEDSARWAAEREAKRAAKAVKLAAIRDAQLARGQRTA